MNIECERFYNRIIGMVCEKMTGRVQGEVARKIEGVWKRNVLLARSKVKRNGIKSKTAENSDEEVGPPETQNICFGTLKKFYKKQPYWRVKIKSCVLKLENSAEFILPPVKSKLLSDFF